MSPSVPTSQQPSPEFNQLQSQTKNKVVLITGATGGIGQACAYKCAASNYDVVIHYFSNTNKANELCEQIKKYNVRAITVKADLSQEQDVKQLFGTVNKTFGRLDALVNNAGITATIAPFLSYDASRINEVFSVNVLGSFLCAREAIKIMLTTKDTCGAIVNISSTAAKIGSPFEYIDYAASKGAIDVFTLGLAKEFAEQNIRVNAVRPGLINTQIHAKSGDANRPKKFAPLIPMQRAGNPEEVANTVAWLLSDEASYLTGSIIDVSGGR